MRSGESSLNRFMKKQSGELTIKTRKWATGFLIFLLVVFGFLANFGYAAPETKKKYDIKVGTMAPANTVWIEVPVQLIIPMWRDMTGGRFNVILYSGGVMGDDNDVIRKINSGQLDGCACMIQGTILAAPELSVFSLPKLFESYDEVDYVIKRLRKRIDDIFDQKGLLSVGVVDTGFNYLFSTKDISTLDLLRKQKIMTWWGEIEVETLGALGITPIPTSVSELVNVFPKGLIDAIIAPPAYILGTRTFTYFKYIYAEPFVYMPATVFVTKKRVAEIAQDLKNDPVEFDRLRQDFVSFRDGLEAEAYLDKLRIKDEAYRVIGRELLAWIKKQDPREPQDFIGLVVGLYRAAEEPYVTSLRKYERKCLEGFFRRGIKKVEWPEEDQQALAQASKKVWEEFSGKMFPEWFLTGILSAINEYRVQKK